MAEKPSMKHKAFYRGYVSGTIFAQKEPAVFRAAPPHLPALSSKPQPKVTLSQDTSLSGHGHDCRNDPITYFGKQDLWGIQGPSADISGHLPVMLPALATLNPTIKPYLFPAKYPPLD